MKGFTIFQDAVQIVRNDNSILTIYFNEFSGKVYYRYKIGTLSNVKHPGIYLGRDKNGNGYFIHNHYAIGKAAVVYHNDFTQGQPIAIYNEMCSNSPSEVIESGLNQVMNGERYHFLTYNCQTFTNQACHNQRKSDDAEKWVGGMAAVGLVVLALGLIAGSK